MLPDGRYSAWFKTAQADGVGIVDIVDQRLIGRDTVIEYSGSFIQDGETFRARISTRRHSAGHAAIFGIDELDLEFEGTSKATTATCVGRIRQLPDTPLEVVLVRISS